MTMGVRTLRPQGRAWLWPAFADGVLVESGPALLHSKAAAESLQQTLQGAQSSDGDCLTLDPSHEKSAEPSSTVSTIG